MQPGMSGAAGMTGSVDNGVAGPARRTPSGASGCEVGSVPVDYPGPVAADWPELLAIVEERVKPERMKNNRAGYRQYWWQYGEKRAELQTAITDLARVLAISQSYGQHAAFRVSAGTDHWCLRIETTIVFPDSPDPRRSSALLQSRPHEIWARFFASSLEDRVMLYPLPTAFETFAFPECWETHSIT